MVSSIYEVTDLLTHIFTPNGVVKAVDGVSFQVREEETLGGLPAPLHQRPPLAGVKGVARHKTSKGARTGSSIQSKAVRNELRRSLWACANYHEPGIRSVG